MTLDYFFLQQQYPTIHEVNLIAIVTFYLDLAWAFQASMSVEVFQASMSVEVCQAYIKLLRILLLFLNECGCLMDIKKGNSLEWTSYLGNKNGTSSNFNSLEACTT